MPKSVLEAIRLGIWDFEPAGMSTEQYEATDAMPGTKAKLAVLAARLEKGMPLWHPADRDDAESPRK